MSALLDALGYVGDSLDKPGRAARGLLGGRPEEALSAVPFSDAMGLTDPGNRVSGSDLLRNMGIDAGDGLGGTLAGMGVEMATDPLTWAGAGVGGLLGKRAGAAAMARGPRYETTADDLARMLGGSADNVPVRGAPVSSANFELQGMSPVSSAMDNPLAGLSASELPQYHLNKILGSPAAADILREVPPGSSLLGTGAEGVALRTPAGDVLRLGEVSSREGGRPVSQNIAQATRGIDFPSVTVDELPFNMRAERVPMASGVGDRGVLSGRNPQTMLTPMDELTTRLRGEGIDFWDRHAGNAGMLGGRPVVIDPGAVQLAEGAAGPLARQAVLKGGQQPSALMSALIGLGGGDDAVRRAIDAGLVDPGMMTSLARLGGMGGAGVGAASRL